MPIKYSGRTCIIVVEIAKSKGNVLIGIIVDSVSEVLNIRAAEIDNIPNFSNHLHTDYILGISKVGARVKILLNIDKVISGNDNGDVMECS